VIKADRSSRSPSTPTNTVASPTENIRGRRWRSPSPAYAYRTGWVPPSRSTSHNTATSPRSPQCHVDVDDASRLSSNGFQSEEHSMLSASSLNRDLTEDVEPHHSRLAVYNGHVQDALVNGCSEVTGSSSPDHCGGRSNVLSGSGGKWAEKRDSSSLPTSIDTVPVLPKSPLSSVDRLPVESLPNGSDASLERGSSEAAKATENGDTDVPDQTAIAAGVPTDRGVNGSIPAAKTELAGRQNAVNADGFTSERLRSADDDAEHDGKAPRSRENGVTSLAPLDVSAAHRDSNLLLSARRTSVDYLQKVTNQSLSSDKNTVNS